MAVDVNAEALKEAIEGNGLVLVDFWGAHCPPCRMFAPIYEKVSQRHEDAIFAKVNTAEHPQLAAEFRIEAVPTLMIFREGVLLFNQAGALPEKILEEVVQKAKDLDMDEVRAEIAKHEAEEAKGEKAETAEA